MRPSLAVIAARAIPTLASLLPLFFLGTIQLPLEIAYGLSNAVFGIAPVSTLII